MIKTRPKNIIKISVLLIFVVLISCSAGTGYYSKKVKTSRTYSSPTLLESPDVKAWRPTQKHSIPVTINSRVKKWIKAFNGSIKTHFKRYVYRLGQYGPIIEQILKTEGVPKDLIYLAMIESGFNMNALSHAHASGPWQFIKSTGRMYGLTSDSFVDERQDVILATQAAARHLKDLYKTYDNWYLAFAAYNAGPGKVNRAIKRGKSKNYWTLTSRRSRLFRQETKDYVPKILAALHIVKNYRKYGYSSKSFGPPLQYETVTVPDATDIKTIAKSARTSEDMIQKLNSSLVMGITPPGKTFSVFIPKGAKEEFIKNYARIPPSQRVSNLQYRSGHNETIYKIAKKYSVSASQLAKINGYTTKQRLRTGTLITIPATKSTMIAMAKAESVRATKGKWTTKTVYYKVKRGDTLSKIAKKNKTTVKKLAQWNRIRSSSILRVGQRLKLYKSVRTKSTSGSFVASSAIKNRRRTSGVAHIILQDQQDPIEVAPITSDKIYLPTMIASVDDYNEKEFEDTPGFIKTEKGHVNTQEKEETKTQKTKKQKPKKVAAKYHTVKPGESLSQIANKYRLKVSVLKSQNNLKSNLIRVGKKLLITKAQGPQKPLTTTQARYTVRSGDTLSRIAQKHKIKLKQLKQWNNLKSSRIKVGQTLIVQKSKVQASTKKTRTTTLPSEHVVKSNETLYSIAKKYRVYVSQLKTWNNLKSDRIKVGQKLFVKKPQTKTPSKKTRTTTRPSEHIVKSGETLYSIAKKYRVYVSQLKTWNNLKSDKIKTGQKLKIKKGTGTKVANTAPTQQKVVFHTIKPGETLWSVSRKYGVKISDLVNWNDLKNNRIKPNQKLKIKM